LHHHVVLFDQPRADRTEFEAWSPDCGDPNPHGHFDQHPVARHGVGASAGDADAGSREETGVRAGRQYVVIDGNFALAWQAY
jgi:hypothetical protein